MAKDLSSAPGIIIDADYVNGKIQNNTTRIGEHINQDIVQFFQKMMDSAGITPNGNFDNEVNGYQFIEALYSAIRNNTLQDRGDPTDSDFRKGSGLSITGSWITLDLSSIVPSNASFVLLRASMVTFNVAIGDGGTFEVRQNGNTDVYNVSRLRAVSQTVTNEYAYADMWVKMDSGQNIEYKATDIGNGIQSLSITVAGWQY